MYVMQQRFTDLGNRHFRLLLSVLLCGLVCSCRVMPLAGASPRDAESRGKVQDVQKKAGGKEDSVKKWEKGRRKSPPLNHETELWSKDGNHRFEYLSDSAFNNSPRGCYMVDGIYIGPYDIGIDVYSMKRRVLHSPADFPVTVRGIGREGDSLVLDIPPGEWAAREKQWPSIRGQEIATICNYESEGVKVDLASLEEIRRDYFPNAEGPVVYMVNKFLITKDEDLYRVDRNFIHKVEMLESECIAPLADGPHFCIIRIFTRTAHNWHPGTVGVR